MKMLYFFILLIAATSGILSQNPTPEKPFAGTTLNVDCSYNPLFFQVVSPLVFAALGITLQTNNGTFLDFTTAIPPLATGRNEDADLVTIQNIPLAATHQNLEPLEPLMQSLGLDLALADVPQIFNLDMYWNNTLYAMPFLNTSLLQFYRTDVYNNPITQLAFQTQFGYPLTSPTTWKQFDDQINFFSKYPWNGVNVFGFGSLAGYRPDALLYNNANHDSVSWFYARFFTYGGQYFDDNLNPLVNTAPGVRALTELVNTFTFYPPDQITAGTGVLALAPFYPFLRWTLLEVPVMNAFVGFGKTVTLPFLLLNSAYNQVPGCAHAGARRRDPFYSCSLAIPKTSTKKAAAAQVLQFLTSPTLSLALALTPDPFVGPWRISTCDSPVFNLAFPGFGPAIKASFDLGVPTLHIPFGYNYDYILSGYIRDAIAGVYSPQEALDRCARDWNTMTNVAGKAEQLAAWKVQQSFMASLGITYNPIFATIC